MDIGRDLKMEIIHFVSKIKIVRNFEFLINIKQLSHLNKNEKIVFPWQKEKKTTWASALKHVKEFLSIFYLNDILK